METFARRSLRFKRVDCWGKLLNLCFIVPSISSMNIKPNSKKESQLSITQTDSL